MKKIIILMVCLWGLGNTFTSAQTTEKEKFISSLMKQMTLDEKIGQLAQCTYRGNFTGPDGGNIPKEEMFNVFNMGVGFIFVVSKESLDKLVKKLEELQEKPMILGEVNRKVGVEIKW